MQSVYSKALADLALDQWDPSTATFMDGACGQQRRGTMLKNKPHLVIFNDFFDRVSYIGGGTNRYLNVFRKVEIFWPVEQKKTKNKIVLRRNMSVSSKLHLSRKLSELLPRDQASDLTSAPELTHMYQVSFVLHIYIYIIYIYIYYICVCVCGVCVCYIHIYIYIYRKKERKR